MNLHIEVKTADEFADMLSKKPTGNKHLVFIAESWLASAYLDKLAERKLIASHKSDYIVIKSESLAEASAFYTLTEHKLAQDFVCFDIRYNEWKADEHRYEPDYVPDFINKMLKRRRVMFIEPTGSAQTGEQVVSRVDSSIWRELGDLLAKLDIENGDYRTIVDMTSFDTMIKPTTLSFMREPTPDDIQDFEQVFEDSRRKMLEQVSRAIFNGDKPIVETTEDGDETILGYADVRRIQLDLPENWHMSRSLYFGRRFDGSPFNPLGDFPMPSPYDIGGSMLYDSKPAADVPEDAEPDLDKTIPLDLPDVETLEPPPSDDK